MGGGDESGREGATLACVQGDLNVCLCVRAIMWRPLANLDASLAGNVSPNECGQPQR